MHQDGSAPMLSIVVPFHDEEAGVEAMANALDGAVSDLRPEVLLIDDGSRDGTSAILASVAAARPGWRMLTHARNLGKTAAIASGFREARGAIIATLDGDLENDPRDIPALLGKLDEGYDAAVGWRKDRWRDRPCTRRLPSIAASALISLICGKRLHDFGCGIAAFRAERVKGLELRRGDHRFIPAILAIRGAKIAEIPVRFSPRRFGRSKTGLVRFITVPFSLVRLLLRRGGRG